MSPARSFSFLMPAETLLVSGTYCLVEPSQDSQWFANKNPISRQRDFKLPQFCNVSARSRHFVNMGIVFLPSVCDGFCVSVFSLGQGPRRFITNCMDNSRSCSAGVDEMRVFGNCLYSLCRPCFLVSLVHFSKNSTVVSASLSVFGLHANILGSMCC